MSSKYIIRRVDFGYNDEYFQTHYAHQGAIQQIYTDKAEAEQAYKKLIIDELQNIDLESYDFGYGEADEEAYEAAEALVLEKTGEAYDKDDGIPKLEPDDLFEFAKLTKIMHYQLLEVDDAQKNYVIWLNQQDEYMTDYDTGSIIYGHQENFIAQHHFDWHFLDYVSVSLQGHLADLSDAPSLLEQVIQKNNGLHYDAEKQNLSIEGSHAGYDAVTELNALLKQPLFEIQEKSLNELQALSQ